MIPFDRFQWLQGWVDDLSLSTTAKACLAVLLRFMNAEGVAWPSLETIAERAGCSVRSARTHLTTAEGANWIARSVKPGHSVVYQATEPRQNTTQPRQQLPHTPAKYDTPTSFDTPETVAAPAKYDTTPATVAALPRQNTTQPRQQLPHTPAKYDTTPATVAAEATTTTTSTTTQEVEEVVLQKFARENFQPENEPDSLDAFLMHVASRHGYELSPAQAMGTAGIVFGAFGDVTESKTYIAARFAEKDGLGFPLPTMLGIIHKDAAGWKKSADQNQTQPNRGGQAPVQTSRLEVRNTEWSSLPETQAWFDTANHEKI